MKILLADTHPEVQSALSLILARLPEEPQLSEAGSLVQLLAQCSQSCPDLVLFDLDLVHPTRSHSAAQNQPLSDLLQVLGRLCPRARVVVMSSRIDAGPEALSAGADGFISKTDSPDVVLAAITQFLGNPSKNQFQTKSKGEL